MTHRVFRDFFLRLIHEYGTVLRPFATGCCSSRTVDTVFLETSKHIPRSRFGLGPDTGCPIALKGRNKTNDTALVSPFQGWVDVFQLIPRALPGAFLFQPFRL